MALAEAVRVQSWCLGFELRSWNRFSAVGVAIRVQSW